MSISAPLLSTTTVHYGAKWKSVAVSENETSPSISAVRQLVMQSTPASPRKRFASMSTPAKINASAPARQRRAALGPPVGRANGRGARPDVPQVVGPRATPLAAAIQAFACGSVCATLLATRSSGILCSEAAVTSSWTRTSDPLLRRQMLYPPELWTRASG